MVQQLFLLNKVRDFQTQLKQSLEFYRTINLPGEKLSSYLIVTGKDYINRYKDYAKASLEKHDALYREYIKTHPHVRYDEFQSNNLLEYNKRNNFLVFLKKTMNFIKTKKPEWYQLNTYFNHEASAINFRSDMFENQARDQIAARNDDLADAIIDEKDKHDKIIVVAGNLHVSLEDAAAKDDMWEFSAPHEPKGVLSHGITRLYHRLQEHYREDEIAVLSCPVTSELEQQAIQKYR